MSTRRSVTQRQHLRDQERLCGCNGGGRWTPKHLRGVGGRRWGCADTTLISALGIGVQIGFVDGAVPWSSAQSIATGKGRRGAAPGAWEGCGGVAIHNLSVGGKATGGIRKVCPSLSFRGVGLQES